MVLSLLFLRDGQSTKVRGRLYTCHAKPNSWITGIGAGPGGQLYYYNAFTQESTYVRPIPPFPMLAQLQAQPPPVKKKKEKPLVKTPIPGTQWIRVKTTEGNVFYTHKERKESFWSVPDEIKAEVKQLEKDEELVKEREQVEAREAEERKARQAEEEEQQEIARLKAEVEESVKRKAVDQHLETPLAKKPRIEEVTDEDDEEDESEEEEWQNEAAAQLAAEAEEERKRKEEEAKRLEAEAEAQKIAEEGRLNMPEKVNLSPDEAKALFKV